jgi:hypothetical protein
MAFDCEENLHHARALCIDDCRLRFGQREAARDQRAGIDPARAKQRERFRERAAARADYVDFLHDDRPGFDRGCAMKRRFQHQRSARLGHLLRHGEAAGRAGRFDQQRVIVVHALQIAGVSANFLSRDSRRPRERQFVFMFAVHHHARNRGAQHSRDELPEFPIAQNSSDAKLTRGQLFENLTCRGQRLDEHGLFVVHVVRHEVQIFERQRQVLGESAVVRDNAQHGASRAVGFESAAAELAGTEAVGRACDVDLAADAAAQPLAARGRRHTTNCGDFGDELVSWRAAKLVVSAENLDVGIANAGQPHAKERPAGPQPWRPLLEREQFPAFNLKCEQCRCALLAASAAAAVFIVRHFRHDFRLRQGYGGQGTRALTKILRCHTDSGNRPLHGWAHASAGIEIDVALGRRHGLR